MKNEENTYNLYKLRRYENDAYNNINNHCFTEFKLFFKALGRQVMVNINNITVLFYRILQDYLLFFWN